MTKVSILLELAFTVADTNSRCRTTTATFDGASDTNNQIDIFDATRGGLLSHLTAGTRYSVDTTTRFVPNGHSYPYVGDDGLILSSAEYASDIWMNNAPVSFVRWLRRVHT